jgi:hypothetical protein
MEQNKYVVKVVSIFGNFVEVEASDEQSARKKAKDIVLNNEKEEEFKLFYETTLPEEHWAVITKEQFDKLEAEALVEAQKAGAIEEEKQ